MADTNGMDITQVDVDATGRMAVNFTATDAPTKQQLTAFPPLPTGYADLGLWIEDGGYAPEFESGDVTSFYQQGYSLATGEQVAKFTLKFAEFSNESVRKLLGIADDVQKTTFYKSPFSVMIITRYGNGDEVRLGGRAIVEEVSYETGSAGEISSAEVTFRWQYDEKIGGFHHNILKKATSTTSTK